MRARLERHVERAAARGVSGLFEGDHLGVADAVVGVPALPHDFAVTDDDGADDGMVARLPAPRLRELERPLVMAHARSWTRSR
jgi:hypothetical protein